MNLDDEPVASDDAIARAMRAALVRTIAASPARTMSWSAVLSRARRVVILRRLVGVSLCVVVLALAASAVAFASTSASGRRGVGIVGSGPTTNATTTTDPTTTSSTLAPSTTSAPPMPPPTISAPGTAIPPAPPVPQSAQAGDFTGVLQHWRQICDPCVATGFDKGITVTIRNTSDHPIDLSTAAPVRVAVVCATNMTADGHLTKPLPAFPPDIFVDESLTNGQVGSPVYDAPGNTLAAGAQATDDGSWGYGIEGGIDPGTATCEGALVATSDGTWSPPSLSVVSRLTNLPTYTFAVVAPAPPTTTTTTTTTLPPETTSTSIP